MRRSADLFFMSASAPFHYRDKPEYRTSILQQAIDTGRLSPREKELIQQFLAERRAKKGLSQGRLSLYRSSDPDPGLSAVPL